MALHSTGVTMLARAADTMLLVYEHRQSERVPACANCLTVAVFQLRNATGSRLEWCADLNTLLVTSNAHTCAHVIPT